MKVYEFDQFKDFFEFQLREKSRDKKGQKISTLQVLAQSLGYSSASSLSMIASGERLPSRALLESLFEAWKVPQSERERIRLKVAIERRERKGAGSSQLISKFNQLAPYHKIDLKQFNLVRDWYVLVIKILAGTPSFQDDPVWISRALGKKISPAQAKKALKLLLDSNLLGRDPLTQKILPIVESTETTHDIPSEAIRENHKGMIQLALEAVDEQSVEQRHLNSLSLQFDVKSLSLAKLRILDFVKKFNEEFSSDSSDQVYQLNVQLFEHSNVRNEK